MLRHESKQKYHHGNLRPILIQSARELAREVGVDAFTLREVSRRAGVSSAAPYYHFPNRAALVRVLVAEAFEELTNAMLEAKHAQSEPLTALKATKIAYVNFALRCPTEFGFMFRRDLGTLDSSQPERCGEPDLTNTMNYRILLESILECQRAGVLAANDPKVMAMSAWSIAHGLACIILDGPIATQHANLKWAEPLVDAVIDTLGLGFKQR
jgi:AcrR family transcriptional regulator